MSKDKGTKNQKKAPADKTAGKGKQVSSYKSEGKNGVDKQPTLEPFMPKQDAKTGSNRKP